MLLIQLETLWKDWKFIEKFRRYQGIVLPAELEIVAGPQVSQEGFIEILVSAVTNCAKELTKENCLVWSSQAGKGIIQSQH